jgi:hypothetical protein
LDLSHLSPSDPNYKPPVPPHRNLGVDPISPPLRLQSSENWTAEIPRKHHHRSRGGKGKGVRRMPPTEAAPPPPLDEEGNVRSGGCDGEEDEDFGLVEEALLVKKATIVGNPMFSEEEQEELMASDVGLDLNLGMDYEQILEYFDNLKESNA